MCPQRWSLHLHTLSYTHIRIDWFIQVCAHTHTHIEANTCTITHAHTDSTHPQACRPHTCTHAHTEVGMHAQNRYSPMHELAGTLTIDIQKHAYSLKTHVHTQGCGRHESTHRSQTKRRPARPKYTLSFVSLFPALLLCRPSQIGRTSGLVNPVRGMDALSHPASLSWAPCEQLLGCVEGAVADAEGLQGRGMAIS